MCNIYIYFALYMIWITMNLRIHKAPTRKEEWASENVQSCWGENLQQLSPLRALWMVAKSCITNLGWLETPWKTWDRPPFSPGESDFAGPSTVPQDTSGYLRIPQDSFCSSDETHRIRWVKCWGMLTPKLPGSLQLLSLSDNGLRDAGFPEWEGASFQRFFRIHSWG